MSHPLLSVDKEIGFLVSILEEYERGFFILVQTSSKCWKGQNLRDKIEGYLCGSDSYLFKRNWCDYLR